MAQSENGGIILSISVHMLMSLFGYLVCHLKLKGLSMWQAVIIHCFKAEASNYS